VTTVDLPAGRDRVTLTARDSSGRTGTATVLVRILPTPPALTLLHAPSRISPRARTLRVQLATLAPAELRVGKLSALIGRATRSERIKIKPGRRTLTATLVLRSGRFVLRVPLTVLR
jgi:hypothetical protein